MSADPAQLPAPRTLTRHRMSADQYRTILAEQGGACALCRVANGHAGRALFIDHDHLCCPDHRSTCGQCTRGLLCSGCNGVLGELEAWGAERCLYRRRLEWIAAATEYLARHRPR